MKKLPLGFWLKFCTLSYDLLGIADLLWTSWKIESRRRAELQEPLMLNPASSGYATPRLRRNTSSSRGKRSTGNASAPPIFGGRGGRTAFGGRYLLALSGLQDVAKALVPPMSLTNFAARRSSSPKTIDAPKNSPRRCAFFFEIFPGTTGGIAVLPAFDSLPWDSQGPHADILERRAATSIAWPMAKFPW